MEHWHFVRWSLMKQLERSHISFDLQLVCHDSVNLYCDIMKNKILCRLEQMQMKIFSPAE